MAAAPPPMRPRLTALRPAAGQLAIPGGAPAIVAAAAAGAGSSSAPGLPPGFMLGQLASQQQQLLLLHGHGHGQPWASANMRPSGPGPSLLASNLGRHPGMLPPFLPFLPAPSNMAPQSSAVAGLLPAASTAVGSSTGSAAASAQQPRPLLAQTAVAAQPGAIIPAQTAPPIGGSEERASQLTPAAAAAPQASPPTGLARAGGLPPLHITAAASGGHTPVAGSGDPASPPPLPTPSMRTPAASSWRSPQPKQEEQQQRRRQQQEQQQQQAGRGEEHAAEPAAPAPAHAHAGLLPEALLAQAGDKLAPGALAQAMQGSSPEPGTAGPASTDEQQEDEEMPEAGPEVGCSDVKQEVRVEEGSMPSGGSTESQAATVAQLVTAATAEAAAAAAAAVHAALAPEPPPPRAVDVVCERTLRELVRLPPRSNVTLDREDAGDSGQVRGWPRSPALTCSCTCHL
jgi:hypothetical protein